MPDQIKKARILYMTKGILKRDFLRSEISLSWARSSFQNVNIDKLPQNEKRAIKKLDISDEEKNKYPFIEAIVILDQNSNVVQTFSKDYDLPYDRISYVESDLGTNGIGLAFNFKKQMYVSNYEHYHKAFFEKLTFGVPHVNGTSSYVIGFVLKMSTAEFREKQSEIIDFSNQIIQHINLETNSIIKENPNFLDEYFYGKSEIIKAFKEKINKLSKQDNNVFLCGPKGVGKEIVARAIHQLSTRKNEKFYSLYCDKLPTNVIIEDYFGAYRELIEDSESTDYGVVYCEAIEALSIKAQEVLIKLLECKPVYTNDEKRSYKKGYRFIFSSEMTLNELENQDLISKKLLNRINVFTVNIPSLTEVKEDIPFMISKRIDKYVEQLFLDPIVFSEQLINELTRYPWPENYRELDKTIEQIVHNGRYEKVIDQTFLPDRLKKIDRKSEVIIPLEKTELREIIRALELMDNNIALTARALGIGRSTLYRKLEKYNIEL